MTLHIIHDFIKDSKVSCFIFILFVFPFSIHSIEDKILLFIFWGHQSVRDRTAQAGAPIFRIHWHLYEVYKLEVRIGLMGLTGQQHTEMP